MGVFGSRKKKAATNRDDSAMPAKAASNSPTGTPSESVASSASSSSQHELEEVRPALKLDLISTYIKDLETAKKTCDEKPQTALKKLFSLSEDASNLQIREELVRVEDGKLVPVLLSFLERCDRGSSELCLALLVLNNISVPAENKRLIALKHNGAKVLCQLLCEDPSCHLVAIVLVNLTFTDAEMRGDLVDITNEIYLLESLAFAMVVSSLTKEQYEIMQHVATYDTENHCTPAELLASLLAEDDRHMRNASGRFNSATNRRSVPDPSQQLFSDTARWSLCAIKNLTRPSKYLSTTHALINTGILPLILRFVTIEIENKSVNKSMSHDSYTPPDPDAPAEKTRFTNAPSTWNSHTSQDAALFIIINLAAVPSARDDVREVDAVNLLSRITEFEGRRGKEPVEESEVLEFQRLKARMALAYLVGSEGHFGQPVSPSSCSILADSVYSSRDDGSALLVNESETTLFVELLANTLHRRSKEGPGGYSVVTFSVKYVLFALRCLLTHRLNQIRFTNTEGLKLNTLLMKVLALHSLQRVPYIDPEAAEHAAFLLYILSNYGFSVRTLSMS
jgi:hypothetical protein